MSPIGKAPRNPRGTRSNLGYVGEEVGGSEMRGSAQCRRDIQLLFVEPTPMISTRPSCSFFPVIGVQGIELDVLLPSAIQRDI